MLRLLQAGILSEILPIGNSAKVLPKLQASSAAELEPSSRSSAGSVVCMGFIFVPTYFVIAKG